MNGVNNAETELGTGFPWRLKLTTNSDAPSGLIDMVAGKRPTVVESTNSSVPVVIFHTNPYGVPCAIETYQCSPLGDTVSP